MPNQLQAKVVLLGEGRVGKTSLVLRFCKDTYSDSQAPTIQASFLDKVVSVGDSRVSLAIWDTAGQERFHALGPIYYRDADSALLVFDITDPVRVRVRVTVRVRFRVSPNPNQGLFSPNQGCSVLARVR